MTTTRMHQQRPTATELATRFRDVKEKRRLLFTKTSKLYEKVPIESFLGDFGGNVADIDKAYDSYIIDKDLRKLINQWRLDRTKTKNKRLIAYLLRQIRKEENFNLEIIGPTGMGKSRVGLRWVLLYCYHRGKNPRFHLDPDNLRESREFIVYPTTNNDFIDIYITYSFSQTRHIIATVMRPGDVVLQDEWPEIHGKGSRIELDFMGNILRNAARKRWLNVIYLSPELVKIKQLHYIIDTLAMNETSKQTLAALSFLRKNSDVLVHSGIITFNVSMPEELITWYEENSNIVKARIQALGGASAVKAGDIEKLARQLVDEYNALESDLLRRFYIKSEDKMASFARTIEDISAHPVIIDDVAALAKFMIEDDSTGGSTPVQPESKVDRPTPPPPGAFVFDVSAYLERYPDSKYARAYLMHVVDGHAQKDVATKLGIEQPTVSKAVKAVKGDISQERGNEYVKWLAGKIQERDKDIIERLEFDTKNTPGKADIEAWYKGGRVDIISVKCEDGEKTSQTKYPEDFGPELDRARRVKLANPDIDVHCKIHYFVWTTGNHDEKDIDYINTPGKISIKNLRSQPAIEFVYA